MFLTRDTSVQGGIGKEEDRTGAIIRTAENAHSFLNPELLFLYLYFADFFKNLIESPLTTTAVQHIGVSHKSIE